MRPNILVVHYTSRIAPSICHFVDCLIWHFHPLEKNMSQNMGNLFPGEHWKESVCWNPNLPPHGSPERHFDVFAWVCSTDKSDIKSDYKVENKILLKESVNQNGLFSTLGIYFLHVFATCKLEFTSTFLHTVEKVGYSAQVFTKRFDS